MRCLLIEPNPESALNDEAGKLFMESYDEFADRARLMTGVHASRRSKAARDGGSACELEEVSDVGNRVALTGRNGKAGQPVKSKTAGKKPKVQSTAVRKQKENKKKSMKRL